MPAATTKTTAKATPAKTAKPTESKATPADATSSESVFAAADTFTSAAREQMETFVSAFNGNADEMREKAEALNEEIRTRLEKTQKHVTEVNSELMEAARTEVSDAVQLANDLTQAKSFADALELQRGYFAKLFETRIERARDLTEDSVAFVRETATPPNGAFSAYFDAKAFEKFFPFAGKA